MRRPISTPAILLSALILAGCPRAPTSEPATEPEPTNEDSHDPNEELARRDAVRQAIEAYIVSLEARDPSGAIERVTHNTFAFYEDLRQLALAGTREQIEARSLMVALIVLELRSRLTRSELEQTDGRAVFERAIRQGLVGENLREINLDEVWIDDAGTRAEIRAGEQALVWLRFEDQRWKIDLPAMVAGLAPLLEAQVAEQIAADGRLRVAYALISAEREEALPIELLDGPLDSFD